MKFKATEEQIKMMAVLACKASKPMGLGHLQHKVHYEFLTKQFTVGEVDDISPGMHLDYVQGRMVKLHINRIDEDTWEVRDSQPRPDYQSWCTVFPTYQALVEAAGVQL